MDRRHFYVLVGIVSALAVASAVAAVLIAFILEPTTADQQRILLMFEHFFTFATGAIVTLLVDTVPRRPKSQ